MLIFLFYLFDFKIIQNLSRYLFFSIVKKAFPPQNPNFKVDLKTLVLSDLKLFLFLYKILSQLQIEKLLS